MNMEDIARLAGVSKSAVSLALSGKPGIGSDTRERILQIVQEMGYTFKSRSSKPEAAPGALAFMALANSGIVLDKYYQQPFFRELIHHVQERCRAKGYSLLFSTIDYEHFERDVNAFAEENSADGVILLGTNLTRSQVEAVSSRIPHLVVLDTCYETLPVHFVEINNVMGAYQAGRYLYETGHRSVGYLASDVRIHNFEERKRGFLAALRDSGLANGPELELAASPTVLMSQEALKDQIGHHLRSGKTLPSAFFCECDYLAISAIKTFSELGYRIPEDLSVVGFDNITEAMVVSPELSTVHVEKEKLAQTAVDLLIEGMTSGGGPKVKTKVDTQLIPRLSCTVRS